MNVKSCGAKEKHPAAFFYGNGNRNNKLDTIFKGVFMSLQFILGGAGSGKSCFLYDTVCLLYTSDAADEL